MATILQLQRAAMCSRYDPRAYLDLCQALVELGDLHYAADVFRHWEHIDPDNPMIAFYRSVFLNDRVVDKMPATCVEYEFDGFAASFDQVLKGLQYQVPAMLAALLEQYLPSGASLRTADLGCGTGLTGLVARPYSSHLVGVDLSSAMLRASAQRGIYDELVKADLCSFLGAHASIFDLILAGDSLVYTGDLSPIFQAVHIAMADAGLLMFSLELTTLELPYVLGKSGRFAHSASGVRETLRKASFEVLSLDTEVLRLESGHAVPGMLIAARSLEAPKKGFNQ